jgi:hypothetical protein
MNSTIKKCLVLILIAIICYAIYLISSNSSEILKENHTIQNSTITVVSPEDNLLHVARTSGPIFINATIFKHSSTLPVYRGVFNKNGSIDLQFQQMGKVRQNVTSPQDAPDVAKRVLESYGGLPEDAVFDGAETTYVEEYNHTINKVTARWPMFTTITYTRNINGLWIVGDSNRIKLTLGSDGELLWIYKEWRNYSYIEDVPLISVNEAINKLERGDLVSTTWHSEAGNVTIDTITPGYYAKNVDNSETLLEPIWMMFGNGDSGYRFSFYVYANKFANFTATPTTGTQSCEITFRDVSSSTRRLWNFGDGTNSTLRNPVHAYQKAGNYSVTLTVWNDLGSDTLSKPNYITILTGEITKSTSGNQARNP